MTGFIFDTLADPLTERRLLAAMIAEPDVLSMADDVQEQDFSDPRCWHVLRAIRELRACGADVGPEEISCEIRLQDMSREKTGGGFLSQGMGTYADKVDVWFILELLVGHSACLRRDSISASSNGFAPYRGERELIEHDMAWLRRLADRRREAMSAA